MEHSLAYRVEYTARVGWGEGRVHKLFGTMDAAQEFADPHEKAARSAGRFHAIPSIQEVGVLTVAAGYGDRRSYLLGPTVEFDE